MPSTRQAERAEAETMYALLAGAPPEVRDGWGMAAARIGGAAVLAARDDRTGFWNKVLGLGVDAPVTDRLLSEIAAFQAGHGVDESTIRIAPDLLPPDWPQLCRVHDLRPAPGWVRLTGRVEDVVALAEAPAAEAEVAVEPVAPADAQEWGEVMFRGFGMPVRPGAAAAAAAIRRPDVVPYSVRLDGLLVGTAVLRVADEIGHLAWCAVLPEVRHRGGQTALLLARARTARERGCRWLTGETGVEAPGTHNTSLHNMLRVGMSVQYERPNWTWRPTRT